MKILLASPYYSEGTCGLFLLKALLQLHHEVTIWDYRIMQSPPNEEYDIALHWGTGILEFPKSCKKKILIYPDDWTYWRENAKKRDIETIAPFYDKVFTINMNKDYAWLPMGYDPDLHRPLPCQKQIKVLFIGTNRSMPRYLLIQKLKAAFGQDFQYFGNGWGPEIQPKYYRNFVTLINSAEIIINEHWNTAPSTKDMEIAACGGLLISDNREGVKMLLPSVPVYNTPEEAIAKIKYYLDHKGEAFEIKNRLMKEVQDYSYINQLSKII